MKSTQKPRISSWNTQNCAFIFDFLVTFLPGYAQSIYQEVRSECFSKNTVKLNLNCKRAKAWVESCRSKLGSAKVVAKTRGGQQFNKKNYFLMREIQIRGK